MDCSCSRVRAAACPLAFGEVSVKERVSFLNYKNAISLIARNGTLYAINYPADENPIRRCASDDKALVRFLGSVDWNKRRAPSQGLPSPGSVEFVIEEDYRITVYRKPRLAVVRSGEDRRFYRIGADDYETALALLRDNDSQAVAASSVRAWVDHYGEVEMWNDEALTLPELPDVTLTYTPGEIRVETISNGNELSYSIPGMPVWNAFFADLTGDGVPELICNCVYGGDGARRVFVYRGNGDLIERGSIDYDKLNPTGWDNWGVNSTVERYDTITGKIMVEYASPASSTMSRAFTREVGYDDFTWEAYAAPEG